MPAPIALVKHFEGKLSRFFCGARHHHNAAIAARLLAPQIQNGAAFPNPTMARPPNAGPTARVILKPTLLAAMALSRFRLGTRSGVIAIQAGAASAPPTPRKKVV